MIDQIENPEQDIVLNARNVSVSFPTQSGLLDVVDDVSFTLRRGKTLGLVGESGCGKSMSALSILRLIPPPGYISAGNMYFGVQDLYSLFEDEITGVRGRHIAMIFQDPMAALNPVFTLGGQIAEAYRLHFLVSRREAAERAKQELSTVTQTEVSLPFITADASGPKHLTMTLTRANLEQLTAHLVDRAEGPCRQALEDAGIAQGEINEVILVGGQTRMPRIPKSCFHHSAKLRSLGSAKARISMNFPAR